MSASKRRVGKTKLEVTTLGLGGAPMGGFRAKISDAEAMALTDAGYDGGVRYFDTSPFYGYGRSELRMGAALREKPREDFVLSTKIGRILHAAEARREDRPPTSARTACPASRRCSTTPTTASCARSSIRIIRLGIWRDRHRADPRRRFLDHQGPRRPGRALQDGDGRRLQGARRAAQGGRDRRHRRRHQRIRHQPALHPGRRLRLHAAGRPLHAARAGRARRLPAGMHQARRLGDPGRAVQFGHPDRRREARRDARLCRRACPADREGAEDRGGVPAPRRRAGRRGHAVPAVPSGALRGDSGRPQHRRGEAERGDACRPRSRPTCGASSSARSCSIPQRRRPTEEETP